MRLRNNDMIFTSVDELDYNNATDCHICNLPLKKGIHASGASDYDITVNHCHLTGKYRGAAHKSCNLNYKLPRFYPVIIQNLSGYDAHLFIKYLGGNIKVILQTDERYISFSKKVKVGKDDKGKPIKRGLRFIDSYKFMAGSLDSLLGNVKSHPNLEKYYQGGQLELLLTEGVYPYDIESLTYYTHLPAAT